MRQLFVPIPVVSHRLPSPTQCWTHLIEQWGDLGLRPDCDWRFKELRLTAATVRRHDHSPRGRIRCFRTEILPDKFDHQVDPGSTARRGKICPSPRYRELCRGRRWDSLAAGSQHNASVSQLTYRRAVRSQPRRRRQNGSRQPSPARGRGSRSTSASGMGKPETRHQNCSLQRFTGQHHQLRTGRPGFAFAKPRATSRSELGLYGDKSQICDFSRGGVRY